MNQKQAEDWKAELFEMMLQCLEGNNGDNFFRLLEAVKDDAKRDPELQANIDKISAHPRLKALKRH